MASPRAVVADERSEEATPRIPISPETFSAIAAENEDLRASVHELRVALRKSELKERQARAITHQVTSAMLAAQERFGERMADVELRASLVPSLLTRMKAIEDHADNMAQKVQALWSERELALMDRRTPEQEESLADAREAARAQEDCQRVDDVLAAGELLR